MSERDLGYSSYAYWGEVPYYDKDGNKKTKKMQFVSDKEYHEYLEEMRKGEEEKKGARRHR